ncbi:MAG TPA: efflux RND transporter periplasmic adaptor subunit [Candidatus Acidoferrales bacterium]|nr:efflux RND transporter periplasmic adaptor subunit [Candidatus Acidoferrales bacterium]
MTGKKFLIILSVVFTISLLVYFLTTPRGSAIPLIGVVDGTDVIVSPQIAGRMIKLNVDEGSEVKKGDLLAELDPSELQAALAQDVANIANLEAKVKQSQQTLTWTDEQTDAALKQAEANVTTARAQLEEAIATLDLDEINHKRVTALYDAQVDSAQDRDTAVQTVKAARANVQSLQDQIKAQQAALAVAQANRKQVAVQEADLASTRAQLQQAYAMRDQANTQLGYTKIYAPLDGIVSVRAARQGEVLAVGSPIVVIVDVDHLWVRADVEESYIDSVHFGDKMKVRLPSGDTIDGTVFFKGVESDFATQRDVSRTKRDIKTFAIKVSVPNTSRRLFTGMTATVLLQAPEKKSWFARL